MMRYACLEVVLREEVGESVVAQVEADFAKLEKLPETAL
jgi:hypothetical protein